MINLRLLNWEPYPKTLNICIKVSIKEVKIINKLLKTHKHFDTPDIFSNLFALLKKQI